MAYWLLQCHPSTWDIWGYLDEGRELTAWKVRNHLDRIESGVRVVGLPCGSF